MPGERSLLLQQYYGHAGNHLWKIIFSLFDKPFSKDYEDRKSILLEYGIALWDVLQYSEGLGSADSAIINEKANDFASFYNKHIQIQTVFFSSKKAEEFYDKYIGKKESKTYYVLPSPSSANTWKTFDEKLAEWNIILKYLIPGFSIYLLEILKGGDKLFYIGMTGDPFYPSARSGFHRLAGHLEKAERSTQNQLWVGLKEKAGIIDSNDFYSLKINMLISRYQVL